MSRYRGFILFAEMRTGSNHLEQSLNLAQGLTCYGEAFNPDFIQAPGTESLCGVSLQQRNRDPLRLVRAMVERSAGLPGFRFFHNHLPEVLGSLLPDPTWAKVILRRDPLESFVSLKIARTTGQWQITDALDRRFEKITFDPDAYAMRQARLDAFQAELRTTLSHTGQAPFEINYTQILDVDVLNGLLTFLDVPDRLVAPSQTLRRQNPEPLRDKVTNPEMLDQMQGAGTASLSPDLAPLLARLRVDSGPCLYLLPPGVPEQSLPGYAQAKPLPPDGLRPWLNRNKGHHTRTVVSHPVARAWRLAQGQDLLASLQSPPQGARIPQADFLAAIASEALADEILRAPDDDVPDLDSVYSPEIESWARTFYNRDYRQFGYGKWRKT